MQTQKESNYMNRRISPSFLAREFYCRCCDKEGIKQELVEALQAAHDLLPIHSIMIITSGYRCPDHNQKAGGKETSSHPKGWAADIKCENTSYRAFLMKALIVSGFTRIGIDFKRGFIHVDMDPEKPSNLIWGY